MNTYLLKNELRKKAREKRASISVEEQKIMSKKIAEKTINLSEFQKAKTVFCYVPLKNEVDTLVLIDKALKSGKRVAVPRCQKEKPLMDFYYINTIDDLEVGSYGILEPPANFKKLCTENSGFCILPGMCFDRFGGRLGYGKGYYDRFLQNFSGVRVGVCFSKMLSENILPKNFYDVSANYVVTDKEIICIGN